MLHKVHFVIMSAVFLCNKKEMKIKGFSSLWWSLAPGFAGVGFSYIIKNSSHTLNKQFIYKHCTITGTGFTTETGRETDCGRRREWGRPKTSRVLKELRTGWKLQGKLERKAILMRHKTPSKFQNGQSEQPHFSHIIFRSHLTTN